MKTIILDPGHGMSNRRSGRYDPGATNGDYTEAEIVMDWANVLREVLMSRGYRVIRTRVDAKDPAAISERANIARQYKGNIMLSLHCNAANGLARGTETFYRGAENKEMAQRITDAVASVLGTKNRGAKTEGASQHKRLAVMAFQPCFLLEIGFIDNPHDLEKMIDPAYRRRACNVIADILTA